MCVSAISSFRSGQGVFVVIQSLALFGGDLWLITRHWWKQNQPSVPHFGLSCSSFCFKGTKAASVVHAFIKCSKCKLLKEWVVAGTRCLKRKPFSTSFFCLSRYYFQSVWLSRVDADKLFFSSFNCPHVLKFGKAEGKWILIIIIF